MKRNHPEAFSNSEGSEPERKIKMSELDSEGSEQEAQSVQMQQKQYLYQRKLTFTDYDHLVTFFQMSFEQLLDLPYPSNEEEVKALIRQNNSSPPPPPVPTVDDYERWRCGLCNRSKKNQKMIFCDKCQQWVHFTCTGIREDPGDAEFTCNKCSHEEKVVRKSERSVHKVDVLDL